MNVHTTAGVFHSGPEDLAACREAIRVGSRTFYAASWLLPAAVRAPSYGLYAFCRLSDDLVDVEGGRMDAVGRLRDRLDRIYAGRPMAEPADRMLADVVEGYAIPREVPEALFEGLEWDAQGRLYGDLAGLRDYAARVAGTVGAMMTLIMGVRDEATLARACDLGVAMQLTNIARDVGEDARAGRIYLPLDWLCEAGIDPDRWLAAPSPSEALRGVVARLLAEAERLYRRSETGIAALPLSCRPAILAARLMYAEIGAEIARNGHDSVTRRARVPASRKATLLARAAGAALWPGQEEGIASTLPEVRFLLAAVSANTARPGPSRWAPAVPWWNLDARFGRVLDIFESLDQRERTIA